MIAVLGNTESGTRRAEQLGKDLAPFLLALLDESSVTNDTDPVEGPNPDGDGEPPETPRTDPAEGPNPDGDGEPPTTPDTDLVVESATAADDPIGPESEAPASRQIRIPVEVLLAAGAVPVGAAALIRMLKR